MSGGFSDGFEVDPEALRRGAREIDDCVAPAARIDLIAAAGQREWYGHYSLYEALGRFCTTWQLAIETLQERGTAAAMALRDNASEYERSDDSSLQILRRAGGPLPM